MPRDPLIGLVGKVGLRAIDYQDLADTESEKALKRQVDNFEQLDGCFFQSR
jgi:hypothetical protein